MMADVIRDVVISVSERQRMTQDEQMTAVLKCLNDAVTADRGAIHSLVQNVVPCNQALADHPTIECGDYCPAGFMNVGMLGVINGVLRAAGIGTIARVHEDEKRPGEVMALIGFTKYEWPDGIDPYAGGTPATSPGLSVVDDGDGRSLVAKEIVPLDLEQSS